MCYVTATELKKNLSHYLKLSETETVYITKNKRIVSVLTNPKIVALENFLKLEGCLAPYDDGRSYEEIIAEGIMKKSGF